MAEKIRLQILIAIVLLSAASCPFTGNKEEEIFVYYFGNGNTAGIPPVDASTYKPGDTVTVLGKGTLERTDYLFEGWRWNSYDAWYTLYQEGDTLKAHSGDVTLYANWKYNGKRFDYSINGNEATITHYIGPYEDIPILEIPSKIEDKPVTRIGEGALADCHILSVVLPEGLKTIEAHGFSNNFLTSVTIPSTVTAIGESAFSNNYLVGVLKIPNGITAIGGLAFQHNSISSVSFGTGLTAIGAYAFAYNALAHLDIPAGITVIEAGAFFKNDIDMIRIGNGVEIKSDSSFGTYGASFRAYYDAHGKKSGSYTYAHTTKEWTGS
ncbi:MAG: leucine-rich repeat domain-containing protein [Spirochaetaceae bacterium]|jgi:hypothetical protein|nr:leucine-rich repeat domain-containing protein [Spirochaetaceae bacterium]